MEKVIESLDVVYYSQAVPSSFYSLTLLALVFDKVYFPGVYIPEGGVDEKGVIEELKRLRQLGFSDPNHILMYNCTAFSMYQKYLKDICVFTGAYGCAGTLENGAEKLTYELESLVYGPPQEGFYPTPAMGFSKGLPGDEKSSINGPSWLSYPANALIYSMKNQIPLINDNPNMPVPALGGVSPKSNAKILSTIMALESVKMVLPNLKELRPDEIAEFRLEANDYIRPFRNAMLRLSKDLNFAINADMSMDEIQNEARFICDTLVYPELEELRRYINDPTQPWYSRLVDLAKASPEIISSFFTMPTSIAVAQLIQKACFALAGVTVEKLNKGDTATTRGYYYLLKIGEGFNKK